MTFRSLIIGLATTATLVTPTYAQEVLPPVIGQTTGFRGSQAVYPFKSVEQCASYLRRLQGMLKNRSALCIDMTDIERSVAFRSENDQYWDPGKLVPGKLKLEAEEPAK
jgi:hypothetical protein